MGYAKKTALWFFGFLATFSLVLAGAFIRAFGESEQPSLDSFNGKNIGVLTGSVFDSFCEKRLPKAKINYFNNLPDTAVALKEGKIDGFITDKPAAEMLLAEQEGMMILDELIAPDDYGFVFAKTQRGKEICEKFDETLKRLSESGELLEMTEKWSGNDESLKQTSYPTSGENGVIIAAAEPAYAPFVYSKNGDITGLDVEIMDRFCEEFGYGMKIEIVDFSAALPGIVAGKYDTALGSISITEERKQSVLFSEPFYKGGIVLVTKDPNAVLEKRGFWEELCESFEKTFIREDRWKLILEGIGTTMLISALAAVGGSVLGFGVCLLRRSRVKLFSGIAAVYIRLLQGTPIVVFLMIMYYLVFGNSDMPAVWVAVIGFAMNFSAYAAEIIRSGIEAVDKGQVEAAKALGFTRAGTFFKIVMPQAAINFLPVYKGEVISLVKSTSVVGYIAVQDLTKMSDIIRARTYEAFFPLISTAVIYFILAWALSLVLNIILKKLRPDHNKRTVKGVVMK